MPSSHPPPAPRKGRGAVSHSPGRFEKRAITHDWDDEWDNGLVGVSSEHESDVEVALETILRPMKAQQIVSRNQSPDIPFNRSINPYQGCEHGCIYCYARPSHSYLDLSPGLDFETRIFFKPNAVERLIAEWSRPRYECQPITIGANTDPYQPAEKELGITRQLLQAFLDHRHPVSLISKGTLMRRDLDLLSALAEENLTSVAISVPTMNNKLKRQLEPRVPSAEARFKLIESLLEAGVPVTLMLAPVIPALTDSEIEAIITRAAECGVKEVRWILLRLPHEVADIFKEWLHAHYPLRAERVMSLLRQSSGGRDYNPGFGVRQRGSGPYAKMIKARIDTICRRHGLNASRRASVLDCSLFEKPGQPQMALDFD